MKKLFDMLFRRSQGLSVDDLEKRCDRLDKDIKSFRGALTMEDEVYSRDSQAAEQFKAAIFDKVRH